MSELDDLLADEVEVEPSLGSRPRLLLVIAALIVGGVLVAVLVSVIVAGLSAIVAEPSPPGKLCGVSLNCLPSGVAP